MTRETKVGLIVGLAFIVVFAVILSHKGNQPRAADSSTVGPIVDVSGPAGVGGSATVSASGRAVLGPDRTPRDGASLVAGDGRRTAERNLIAPPLSVEHSGTESPPGGSRISLPPLPTDGTVRSEAPGDALSESLETWLGSGTAARTNGETGSSPARTAPPTVTPVASDPPPRVENPEPVLTPPTPIPAAVPDNTPKPKPTEEYIAQKGDNLTKIATNVYGRGGRREIEAILNSNRDQLPNADTVREGMKLQIPPLQSDKFEATTFPPSNKPRVPLTAESSTAVQPSPASPGHAKTDGKNDTKAPSLPALVKDPAPKAKDTATPPKDAGAKTRTYVMQTNDTYAALARKYLGSADRWKEIHALNKAKYPDPMKVPAGAKIKVPASGDSNAAVSGLSKL